MWDFHLHSQYSDGSTPVEQIFAYAAKNQVTALAVTDHDTILGIAEEKRCSKIYGIPYIAGAEFTAFEDGMKFHVLGYHLNESSQELLEYSKCFLEVHNQRTRKQIHRMQEQGIPITEEECFELSGGGPLYRAKLLDVLSHHGYLKQEEIMAKIPEYFGKDSLYYVEDEAPYRSFTEICDLIHRNDGIVVLAHPGKIKRKNESLYYRMVGSCLLDGLEIFHKDNSEEVKAELLETAKNRGLIYTGGSDNHGRYMRRPHPIGSMPMPEQVYQFLAPYMAEAVK